MADRTSLEILGLIFGGVTVAVMLMAFITVKGHVDGRYMLEGTSRPIASVSTQSLVR